MAGSRNSGRGKNQVGSETDSCRLGDAIFYVFLSLREAKC